MSVRGGPAENMDIKMMYPSGAASHQQSLQSEQSDDLHATGNAGVRSPGL
jgi:hypothetical protein